MTATTESNTETTTVLEQPSQTAAPSPETRITRRDLLRWGGIGGFAALMVNAVVAAAPVYARRYTDRVYPGVAVAGVSLAGLTRAEATARLTAEGQRYAAQPLQFTGAQAGQAWSLSPGEVGLRYDYTTVVERALATHRGESRWDRFTGAFAALLPASRAVNLTLPAAIDENLLLQRLRDWADTATTPPTNASFATADGQLTITPDQTGRGISYDPTHQALIERASRLAPGPIALAMEPVTAPVTAARLGELLPQAQAITAQPLALEHQGRRWALDTAQLRAALGYQEEGGQLALTIDTSSFRPTLQATAREVAAPPTNAKIVRNTEGRFSIEPEKAGAVLDETTTLAGIERALLGGIAGTTPAVALVMKPEPPAVTAADLEPSFRRLDAILNTPLVITLQEYNLTLHRGDILPLLTLEETPNGAEKLRIGVDQTLALALARDLAEGIDKPARDAQFRWLNGAVQATTPSEDGRTVEIEPTAGALATAILGATGTLTPVVTAIKPKVDGAAQGGVVIRERLTSGNTDYSFSIASRKHNVELSMERLNGALVAPDGIFSFNQAVGAQTVENGYQAAYGIAMVGGAGGQAKTVSSVAGGICQVSTTLFQAVYHAGLPVEERNWHLFWINGYGQPPSGLKGLDATVDDQSALDFKFRNTTGNWLAVEAAAEGGRVKIALHGTNPGWQVQIDPPVITNERKADPTMVTEKTHDLPPGQRRQVESAVDGFDAANHTVVRDGAGNILRDVTFRSSYLPSRNVTQVGVPKNEPLT